MPPFFLSSVPSLTDYGPRIATPLAMVTSIVGGGRDGAASRCGTFEPNESDR